MAAIAPRAQRPAKLFALFGQPGRVNGSTTRRTHATQTTHDDLLDLSDSRLWGDLPTGGASDQHRRPPGGRHPASGSGIRRGR